MKPTCNVGIISLIRIFGLVFNWRDLFQVRETDAICVLYIICSPLSKSCSILPIVLGLMHCWYHFYAVLLHACPCLLLAQLDSSVYIKIQFELH